MNRVNLFADRLWLQTAYLIAALLPLTLLAFWLEQRTFNGINLWIKPLKFQFSTVVHLLTLYLAAGLMTEAARRARLLVALIWMSSVFTLFEIGIISIRASQGTASHYNFSTPTDAIVYALMGVGAVAMVLPALYLGIQFLRDREGFRGGPGLHLGIGVGFICGTLLTLVFAGYMSSNGSHWTSGQDSDFGGLPFVGWSQTGGDLRPAHFFALHLIQIVPLFGLLADRYLSGTRLKSAFVVLMSTIMISGLAVMSFSQALNGKPFLSINPPTGLRDGQQPITKEAEQFWQNLKSACGKQFVGEMTYPTEGQDSFRGKKLVANVRDCEESFIAIPFVVGQDQSRTWQFTKTVAGIRFKHDHRHNGRPDPISNYGGMSDASGNALSQSFPADAYTAQILPQASTNVWTLTLSPDGKKLRYHLERHGKPRFSAELTRADL